MGALQVPCTFFLPGRPLGTVCQVYVYLGGIPSEKSNFLQITNFPQTVPNPLIQRYLAFTGCTITILYLYAYDNCRLFGPDADIFDFSDFSPICPKTSRKPLFDQNWYHPLRLNAHLIDLVHVQPYI